MSEGGKAAAGWGGASTVGGFCSGAASKSACVGVQVGCGMALSGWFLCVLGYQCQKGCGEEHSTRPPPNGYNGDSEDEEGSFEYEEAPNLDNPWGGGGSEASRNTGNSKDDADKEAAHNPAAFWGNESDVRYDGLKAGDEELPDKINGARKDRRP